MYSSRAAVQTLIPPQFFLQSLDDDADGVEDVGLWEAIAAAADGQVDAYLSGRYSTPFVPVPGLVAEAAKVFICESLYARRGYEPDRNPHSARANKLRTQLEAIGNGNGSLGGDSASPSLGTRPPVAIVSEPSRTTPSSKINA